MTWSKGLSEPGTLFASSLGASMVATKKRGGDKGVKAPTPKEVEENLKRANLPKEQSAKYHPYYQGKIEIVPRVPVQLQRLRDLVHPGGRAALPRHRRGPEQGVDPDEQVESSRHRNGRDARPGPRRHRARGRIARHGRQVPVVQVSRRRRRVPDSARDEGPRENHRDGQAHHALVRRC